MKENQNKLQHGLKSFDALKEHFENSSSLVFENENSPVINESPYTRDIISTVAFLAGVPESIFRNPAEPPMLSYFESLSNNKNAKIIRSLCSLRTSLIRNFKRIAHELRREHHLLENSSYIPQKCFQHLSSEKIYIAKSVTEDPAIYEIEINKIISDRINNCKNLFPTWVNWEYIKNLFLMPNGTNQTGTKAAATSYYTNFSFYPYQVYINWSPEDCKNLFRDDNRFLTILYKQNHDEFKKYSKLSDAKKSTKDTIYKFIADSEKVAVVVDCENADPYKLYATLKNLESDEIAKISKIILIDDNNTTRAWDILNEYIENPVEYLLIDRINENKSLVDITLTARTCEEYYKQQTDSFILVSSDSDFWALINSLPQARFMVMMERSQSGKCFKASLRDENIFYCFVDDFFSGNCEDIKLDMIFSETRRLLKEKVEEIDYRNIFKEAVKNARVSMSNVEEEQLYRKHIRSVLPEFELLKRKNDYTGNEEDILKVTISFK